MVQTRKRSYFRSKVINGFYRSTQLGLTIGVGEIWLPVLDRSRRIICHSFFFISTSKLTVIMRTLDLSRFYRGRRRFRAFELILSCDFNWFPVSPNAFIFCHTCGRANSTWTYYSGFHSGVGHTRIKLAVSIHSNHEAK